MAPYKHEAVSTDDTEDMMKPDRIIPTVLGLMLSAFMLTAAPEALAYDGGEQTGLGLARVSYMNGDVLFNSDEDDEWAEATPNFPLVDGDRLWVGDDSKMEVRFDTGESAWVNYQTELDILSLTRDDDGNAYQMGLPFGEASFDVGNFEVLGSVLQVDTPNASIRAFGRALFRVTALADGTTQVGVSEGSVEVESERGIANIHSDEMLEVYPDGRSRIMDLPDYDDWDEWVDSRLDRYTADYASARYLPSGMHGYADEFDEGGRWVSYPEYGNVWVPYVEAGWSPYSNGRWIWQGGNYVWLGYDPWYAPFHYGRWHWTARFGWCWLPPMPSAVFWSPGYVGWVWDVDYVYWVPLAPGEIYYGYGYYGPGSVNIYQTNVIINKNVYVNSRHHDGVVVVKRDNFLHGKTVRIREEKVVRKFKEKIVRKEIIKEKIVKEEVSFGAPPVNAVKAIKASRHPRPDRVVKAEKLPQKVVKRERFEKKRKVVKGTVKSAFEPDKAPRYMKDLERLNKPEFKRNGAGTKKDKRTDRTLEKKDRAIRRTPSADDGIIKRTTREDERKIRKEFRNDKRTGKSRTGKTTRPERDYEQAAPKTREQRDRREMAPTQPEDRGYAPSPERDRGKQRGDLGEIQPRAERKAVKEAGSEKERAAKKLKKEKKRDKEETEKSSEPL